MKLILEPDHPLAKAIRATADSDLWNATLSLDVFDRSGNHRRPLCMRIDNWKISRAGRHAAGGSDAVFECELIEQTEERRRVESLPLHSGPHQVNQYRSGPIGAAIAPMIQDPHA